MEPSRDLIFLKCVVLICFRYISRSSQLNIPRAHPLRAPMPNGGTHDTCFSVEERGKWYLNVNLFIPLCLPNSYFITPFIPGRLASLLRMFAQMAGSPDRDRIRSNSLGIYTYFKMRELGTYFIWDKRIQWRCQVVGSKLKYVSPYRNFHIFRAPKSVN